MSASGPASSAATSSPTSHPSAPHPLARPHLFALLVLAWLIVWQGLSVALVSGGGLWTLLGNQLAQREDNALQDALFQHVRRHGRPPKRVVIGDAAFLAAWNGKEGASGDSLQVALDRPRPLDVGQAMLALRGAPGAVVIAQTPPWFFTDLFHESPPQSLALWDVRRQGWTALTSFDAARGVVEALRQWSQPVPPGRRRAASRRPATLMNTEFRAHPTEFVRLAEVLRTMDESERPQLVWVEDPTAQLPPDAPPDLAAKAAGLFGKPSPDPDLGRFVPWGAPIERIFAGTHATGE